MSVRRSLAWSYGSQALVFLVSFGSSVVVARVLGPYEMGVFAIAMATAGLLSVLSSFGVAPYLVRHQALDPRTTRTVFTVNALLNVVVSIILALAVFMGSVLGLDDNVREVLGILAATPLIAIFEFLPTAMLQRDMRFRAIGVIAVGRVLVSSITVVAFAIAGFSYVSPALALVAAALYSAIAVNVVGWRYVSLRPGFFGWQDVVRFGVNMMTITGVATIAQRLGEIVLGRILGLAALGTYARASSLADQVWYNVYGQATRVIFAQMAAEMRNTSKIHRTFLVGISIITALIWPFLMGLAVLSRPVVHLLYGEKWAAAAIPLSLLMLAHVIALGFGMNWELCVLTKKTGWQARAELLKAMIGFAAFTGGSLFGMGFAAGGRIAEAFAGLIIYGPQMREMAGTKPGEIIHIFWESALLTFAAVSPSFVLMCVTKWSPTTSWLLITGAIIVGVTLWFILLKILDHRLLTEIARIVPKRVFRRHNDEI